MPTRINQSQECLIGLLECPLRLGYIEFEYNSGDLVSELKAKISEVWGPPEAVSQRNRWSYGLFDAGAWVILCEDEDGAYVPLKEADRIPDRPLPCGDVIKGSSIHEFSKGVNMLDDASFLEALIHEDDLRYAAYHNVHISATLHKNYNVPISKNYSVKLIALVAVAGG